MTQPTPPTQPPDDDARDEDHVIPADVFQTVAAAVATDADAPGLQATWDAEIDEAAR